MRGHTHGELPSNVALEVALLAAQADTIRRLWRDESPQVIARQYAVEEMTIRTLISCNACRDQAASSPAVAQRR